MPAKGAAGGAEPSIGFSYDDALHRQVLTRFIAVKSLDLNFADNPHWEELIRTSFNLDYSGGLGNMERV